MLAVPAVLEVVKSSAPEPPPPAPEKPKKIENMPDYSIKVDVPLVTLDVLVTTKDGQTIPGLKQDNFKALDIELLLVKVDKSSLMIRLKSDQVCQFVDRVE